ncbi:hypothetical protein [Streptomyces liangshanensis]|uniref:Uncharacterized protein n=1 Tax=Streptomyces liangshanensis TaxID=2717324 RepID=A0A6G9GU96_9ACTN|nr:hypothetical protein [Streptomyces liangshanensis]QIQ01591.1 hypothetical protein HA039_04160 [Streptomyces liangshanensis]
MSSEEKRAWIMAVVTVAAYGVYLAVIGGRAGGGPLADVSYVPALLWTVGAAILLSIVLNIAVALASPEDAGRKDQRDREINRFGEYVGQSFLVVGGVAALVMAMAELDYFWIANAVYLAFVLSSILGSAAKLVAYRRGFQPW